MEKIEQTIREYEQVMAEVLHWDNLSWTTSQFFVAIEALFLAGIGNLVYDQLKTSDATRLPVVVLLLGATGFNIVLCWVWFRVNRCNREWLSVRLRRAAELETVPGVEFRTLTRQREEFGSPKYRGHDTGRLEQHIPSLFVCAWLVVASLSIATLWK